MKFPKTILTLAAVMVLPMALLVGCGDSVDEDVAPAASSSADDHVEAAAPQQAQTFGETLDGDALAWYNWLPQINRDDIEFFAEAAGHEAAREWLSRAMPKEPPYGTPLHLTQPLPSLDALDPGEKGKLDSLDPRIREAFGETWEFGVIVQAPISRPSDPKAYVAGLVDERSRALRERLMAIPAVIPPVDEILHPDELAQYGRLHPELRDLFWKHVAMAYSQGTTVAGGGFPSLTPVEIKDRFSQYIPSLVHYQKKYGCSDHSRPCMISQSAP